MTVQGQVVDFHAPDTTGTAVLRTHAALVTQVHPNGAVDLAVFDLPLNAISFKRGVRHAPDPMPGHYS